VNNEVIVSPRRRTLLARAASARAARCAQHHGVHRLRPLVPAAGAMNRISHAKRKHTRSCCLLPLARASTHPWWPRSTLNSTRVPAGGSRGGGAAPSWWCCVAAPSADICKKMCSPPPSGASHA
jgi:hypothetical protein